ncbi:MAG: hypothetical protein EOP11_21930 [Proteobacteria bacterium]|nr:MAG: hypothetical protein EOP11_21930 [Pseudomonadota bacterium]
MKALSAPALTFNCLLLSLLLFLPSCGGKAEGLPVRVRQPSTPERAAPPIDQSYLSGIRLDPGYIYDMPEYEHLSPSELSQLIVKEIAEGGFNTIFLYAYSPVYGAYYRTFYPATDINRSLGFDSIVPRITSEAKRRGLRVIAVLPVNDFKQAWNEHPEWRVKTRNGKDYAPDPEHHYLSPAHPGFRAWHQGFLKDFLRINPEVDGVEAVEPGFDLNWDGSVDYNEEAVKEFARRFPNASPRGSLWEKFRAALLTEHLGNMFALIHEHEKQAFVVQTWPARKDGSLLSSDEIMRGLGFDWQATLNLPGAARPDWVNGELIFQQWRAKFGGAVFTPAWTQTAAKTFTAFVGARARTILHAEYSNFDGKFGSFSATLPEVAEALKGAKDTADGQDVYDYHLWRQLRR